jgi:hypothetical protein
MTAGPGNAAAQSYSQDCSICLNSIAVRCSTARLPCSTGFVTNSRPQQPCQCLFVAPCSHTWHYKCIRSLLSSPHYPIFTCPNCRAAADLEAEVEDPEEWEQMELDDGQQPPTQATSNGERGASLVPALALPRRSRESTRVLPAPVQLTPPPDLDTMDVTMHVDASDHGTTGLSSNGRSGSRDRSTNSRQMVSHATSAPVPIPSFSTTTGQRVAAGTNTSALRGQTGTPSPTEHNPVLHNHHEGPITPRNDAGPWVFDGSGGRIRGPAPPAGAGMRLTSLDTAADTNINGI